MGVISSTTNMPSNQSYVLLGAMSLRSAIYSSVRRSDAKMPG